MLRAARFEAKLGFSLDGETGSLISSLRGLLGSVPPARLFDETLKLFLTGHGAMSLVVLQRHGLLGELLPTVASYLEPESRRGRVAARATGSRQHRSARGRRQAGDPDVPVCAAAVRTVRRDHREAAAGEVARHRHDCRRRGSRGAPGAGPHLHSETIFTRRAGNVRGAAAPRTTARPARAAHAGATAFPRRLRPAAVARRDGSGLARARGLVDEGPGSLADRSRSHGGCAGATATSRQAKGPGAVARVVVGGAAGTAHPRPHERRSGRGCVRKYSLVAGLCRRGQQSRGSARAGGACTRGDRPASRLPPGS